MRRLVVCDDEELVLGPLAAHLRAQGYHVDTVQDGKACLEMVLNTAPDAVVLDVRMPHMDGLTCLRKLRESGSDLPVVMVTGHGGVDDAIEATRLGAAKYLTKPLDLRQVSVAVDQALEATRMAEEVASLRAQQGSGYGDMVGRTPEMLRIFDLAARLEGIAWPTVLMTGETGTGKHLMAQTIHARGARAAGPFVEVPCAGLSEQGITSQLFGHEVGAFSGADQQRHGLFEVARGGTIFLDDVSALPLATQGQLLRAMEHRRFKRAGGVVDLPLESSIIAATSANLDAAVASGRFRQDLHQRLSIVPIALPPLRERLQDLPLLVVQLIAAIRTHVAARTEGVDAQALAALARYHWPGNVRELRNVIERAMIVHPDAETLSLPHLPPEVRFALRSDVATDARPMVLPEEGVDLALLERSLIEQALARTGGNQTAAARLLGITRYALRYRIEKFDLA